MLKDGDKIGNECLISFSSMEVYMVDNNNVFYSKTHEELILLFEQFLESEKTGSIPDNELGKIRDEYCERYRPNGILMLITDLTRVLAELWYEDNR